MKKKIDRDEERQKAQGLRSMGRAMVNLGTGLKAKADSGQEATLREADVQLLLKHAEMLEPFGLELRKVEDTPAPEAAAVGGSIPPGGEEG